MKIQFDFIFDKMAILHYGCCIKIGSFLNLLSDFFEMLRMLYLFKRLTGRNFPCLPLLA